MCNQHGAVVHGILGDGAAAVADGRVPGERDLLVACCGGQAGRGQRDDGREDRRLVRHEEEVDAAGILDRSIGLSAVLDADEANEPGGVFRRSEIDTEKDFFMK